MKYSGFSLVEILIALSILIMVIFIGNLGYRTYSVYWEKELGNFENDFSELKGVLALRQIIRNIKPIVITSGRLEGHVYFEGGDSLIRGMTNESFVESSVPAVFELKIIQQGQNEVSVEYREFPVSEKPFITENDLVPYSNSFVLLSGLQDIRFEYFGWKHYSDFAKDKFGNEGLIKPQKSWFGLYSAKDTLISPERIKIKFQKNGDWSEIQIPLTHFFEPDLQRFVGADI